MLSNFSTVAIQIFKQTNLAFPQTLYKKDNIYISLTKHFYLVKIDYLQEV